ncbi:MAG: A/G-specific adenine glycosylase [Gammaproteobacteria bacterium RIFCSPLOWO2_02_FULL_42_14]|nr:MAG: A/G-specific adenine glycosylase [Gammaproteobacteria bacterium RIFCSPHIGHO2_02_FULL_42_43]OGT53062.1 MAG: A/G-specific adenine glycosylase [Gammaproteobacteria bacterium RIFCSPHIGHO2_12_FULL_41_25]OGT61359.1 MAG: A/G-specific adenine glycosylase [Gammaproteobacteria bacterium RIFCSPLOWO2_02_FULL_42_14]OGT87287.1 MAG: A/G-specific adenine glycosylase [Gammaproteobacteria bacterium RIFCSPLOWO2_12_FULL_42_18]
MKNFFSTRLLKWYEKNGRHDLPWQKNTTPYRVWISEIMLQQTQVATVIPYYQRFLSRFPDVQTLATASEDDVLSLWSGLGYYARARNLHRTAKIVVKDFQGNFPRTAQQFSELPGIGQSTAGAILSFSEKKYAVILDGNVKRVLTRYFAIETPVDRADTIDQLWTLAAELTPKKNTHHYNQAIMDLGATLCARTQPRCDACPLTNHCEARQQNKMTFYPVKQVKKERPVRKTKMDIIVDAQSRVLLVRRPSKGIWGGLWTFPENNALKLPLQKISELPTLTHQFTHFTLHITPIYYRIKKMPSALDSSEMIWYNWSDDLPGGVPTPVTKILKIMRNHIAQSALSKIGA